MAKLRSYLALRAKTDPQVNPSWSYADFSERLPVTTYEDWHDAIDRKRRTPGMRFEPTSGSTSRRKWIPYPREFTSELDLAASAWITDLAREYPAVLGGRHYWSISWLPDELRGEQATADDTQVFSGAKRWIVSKLMAVPSEVSRLRTLEESRRACLTYLAAASDLTLMSVWSPTFALEFLGSLAREKDAIADVLASGRWNFPGLVAPRSARAAAILKAWNGELDWEITRELWPRLALVSSWDSSTSAPWAHELRALFPHAAFQGKGLWATEGVVTFPFEESFPVAVASHFIEFRSLDDGRVYPAWKLETGMRLQPLLTTGSGFFRYALPDQVEVTGLLERTPTLRFLGRIQGADLVGEKIDATAAAELLRELSLPGSRDCVSLLASREAGGRPRYVLLARGNSGDADELSRELEEKLGAFHHYKLARELGQLDPARAVIREDALAQYESLLSGARIPGSLKIEPVTVVDRASELFHA